MSANENIKSLKERLLSPDGRKLRVAILDNVKTFRLSWAELEGLVTSPIVSGRELYFGEGQRSNYITWFITLNGVSLATDMAQRSVVIKLAAGANSANWYEDTLAHINKYRSQIIGDIIGILSSTPMSFAKHTRWALWERGVLSHFENSEALQRLILERQGDADCDLDEARIIEDYFASQLKSLSYDVRTCKILIPVCTLHCGTATLLAKQRRRRPPRNAWDR